MIKRTGPYNDVLVFISIAGIIIKTFLYNISPRYESYLIEAQITVKNGSLSHVQLLDTMPNVCSQHDSKVAEMILKAGLYVYNARCAPIGISGQHCQMMLSDQELPANTPLGRACRDSLERNCQGQNNNNNTFQRLLPRHYQDGFYKVTLIN